ncbi:MAG TPA: hemerythrin domain-containing protein [Phycisphaerae bacterium]|jgi:iron-sulfur cluster repair protein YtfE (RIC family)|nr:hemerythrin domain-containing protein [Phycisphaerae bacterium]HPC21298.1 hemerythrin domain-containing protein [Phycisphaerae bacterium]HRS27257.1 hemerythrin domain-containing protein [Phycisphaerae bacterium]HRT42559.1 hemerythrin domain-containing protein [Phycisphaerae bacterium]
MDEATLASWMRNESARIRDLASELREHVTTIPPRSREPWLKELALRFDHLKAHLYRMMAIEEEDGYLTPVIEHRPGLTGAVEALRHEHDELRWLTENLAETVRNLKPEDNLILRDTCTRIQVYLGHVQRHEEHENHIVLYTLTEDIGTTESG